MEKRDSEAAVAYSLLASIAYAEDKRLHANASSGQVPDRKWILDTYAECLEAVQGDRKTK